MISHGLSGLLLPVRLADESVDVQSIGVILSLYSVGFLFGAIWAKKILRRIGLVRSFCDVWQLGRDCDFDHGARF